MARRLERAGVGAIVLPSLFEEEILAEEIGLTRSLEQGTEVFAEALDYFPAIQSFAGAADRYVTSLQRVKASVTIPVIASLNGSTLGGWVGLARRLEDAGADALELNLYHVSADPRRSATDMEKSDLDLIAAVRASITIPLAVKLSPFYSAFANFAAAARDAGADGLVLFNRFYQPDLDLESIEVVPRLQLSQPWEMRLPVRWIAILRPQLDPDVSLAATSGAHSGADIAKGLLVGADVVMMTSALLRHGPEHIAAVEAELRGLDGRARVQVRLRAARQCERGDRRGPIRVRARELHDDAPLVGRQPGLTTEPAGAGRTGTSHTGHSESVWAYSSWRRIQSWNPSSSSRPFGVRSRIG